jgi:hypothetical protein
LLFALKELPPALQLLQKHADAARQIASNWLSDVDTGKRKDDWDQLTDGIVDAVSELTLDGEASSSFVYGSDQVEMTLAWKSDMPQRTRRWTSRSRGSGKTRSSSRPGYQTVIARPAVSNGRPQPVLRYLGPFHPAAKASQNA